MHQLMSAAKPTSASRTHESDRIESLIIGKIFTRRRVARGLSQAQVASAVGTTQATISRLEEGRNERVDYFLVQRVAGVLKLDVERLQETVKAVKTLGRPLAARLPGAKPTKGTTWWEVLQPVVVAGLVVALVATLLSDD